MKSTSPLPPPVPPPDRILKEGELPIPPPSLIKNKIKEPSLISNKKKLIISGIFLTIAAHSLCCVLPIICFALGISSISTYFEFLHPYEGYLVALNCILILCGYYVHYLHITKSKCDHKHCHSNSGRITYWIMTSISFLMMIWSILNH